MANKKYYFSCFSINLHRFLKANGLKYLSKGTHANGKIFFVYERDEKFEELLEVWSKNKPSKVDEIEEEK